MLNERITSPQNNSISAAQPAVDSNVSDGQVSEQSRISTGADFQSFLELLTAQLRNQDPLSPLDSSEFVAQLASFSSVEQLVNANTRLEAIESSIIQQSIENYAGLIGKTAVAPATFVNVSDQPISFQIQPQPEATSVKISVQTLSGGEVAVFESTNTGNTQQWSPEGVPTGQYSFVASFYDDDQLIGVDEVALVDSIQAINFRSDSPYVHLRSGSEVPVSTIIELNENTPE